MDRFWQVINLPFEYHLTVGILLRAFLTMYGDIQDIISDVPYTDIDYKVFTDAARHVLDGNSPYKRHTYRYSPIIAYLMIFNITVGRNFGKAFFSICDILVTIALKNLVQHRLGLTDKVKASQISVFCSLFWLYNPVSIAISTRGNADSLPSLFVILSLLFLQTDMVKGLSKYFLSGISLGISIHLRLYPLVFSFPMYLSLGEYKINRKTNLKDGMLSLLPNRKQIILASSCFFTLVFLTCSMFLMYGYEFLFETYIYHMFRKDTRHNFSVLFYYSYLTMDNMSFDVVKAIAQFSEFIVLFVLSLTFGCDPKTLPFALFSQAIVLVSFNSVITSQYFIWFLSLLPLVVYNFRTVPSKAAVVTIVWLSAQGAWLFYAYILEFKSREVFVVLWVKSIVLFCSSLFVLGQLIQMYTPGYVIIDVVQTKPKSK